MATARSLRGNWLTELRIFIERREHAIAILVTLCVIGLLAVGLLITALAPNTAPRHGAKWGAAEYMHQKEQAKPFELMGVSLGTTADKVRSAHVGVTLVTEDSGEQVASFHTGKGLYTIRFADEKTGNKAYRIRFEQSYRAFSEADLLRNLAVRFGKPATSGCEQSMTEMARICKYYWWVRDGASLEAETRVVIETSGMVHTDLRLELVDTNIEGKRMRELSKDRGARLPYMIPKGESLPF